MREPRGPATTRYILAAKTLHGPGSRLQLALRPTLPWPPGSVLRRRHRRHHHHHGARLQAPPRPRSPLPSSPLSSPTLAVYLLSFTFTGIYWINHHHLVHRLKRVDAAILYANLFFLFALSLLPFCTSYALAEHFDSFSVAIYASSLLLSGVGFLALSKSITRHRHRHGTLGSALEKRSSRPSGAKACSASPCTPPPSPLAYWHPLIAAADIALVTLVWIVPGFLIRAAHQNGSTTGNHLTRRIHPTIAAQRPRCTIKATETSASRR